MTSPEAVNAAGTRAATSSSTPTMPIIGVGMTAPLGLSLYSETLPPVMGVFRARQASAMPRHASRNWKKISGLSGLPKLRQLVTASGRAPVTAMLRAASATHALPPS